MKKIENLISDIKDVIGKPFDADTVRAFGQKLGEQLAARLATDNSQKQNLRVSNLGTPCERKLWYSVNTPEDGAPLTPTTRLKFLLGDIFEEVMLFLAKAAGHTVEKEQADVSLHGVPGHIDAIIDGELCDVKSASPYSFVKFKDHGLVENDPFGYVTQLDGYLHSLADEPLLLRKDRGHFLVGQKVLGSLVLDTYPKRKDVNYEVLIADKKKMLAFPQPPARGYSDQAEGASGNRKLGMECSYCPFHKKCWPGVRTFLYSRGPVRLTVVKRLPDVPEVDNAPED